MPQCPVAALRADSGDVRASMGERGQGLGAVSSRACGARGSGGGFRHLERTVGVVRESMESGGQSDHLDRTVGKDGKSYPARRPVVTLADTDRKEGSSRLSMDENSLG